MEDKCFSTSEYNKFTNNILDTKVTQKKLINESDLNEKIITFATKEEIKKWAIKAELKMEHDKIRKL